MNFELCVLVITLSVTQCSMDLFELNIVHFNDFHARFEEINQWSGICESGSTPCIGGIARLATAIKHAFEKEPNSILLDAGDSFQGSIWYNLLRWNVTQEFMNMLPIDVHTLGNHEFDNGIAGVVPYIEHLKSVTVVANIDDSEEPSFQGLTKKSEVIVRNGRRIGVIGVLIAFTKEMSSVGGLRFTDELTAVKEEAENLNAQGVDIIIVLSHCGIELDLVIAKEGGSFIDVIVGGHSHSLMYNGPAPGKRNPIGPYPMVVQQTSGKKIPIVQAAAFTEYLGVIKLFFDNQGDVLNWSGNPVYLDHNIEQDPEFMSTLAVYRDYVEEQAGKRVGETRVLLSNDCSCTECNLGDFICDAFLDSVLDKAKPGHWHYANLCLINQGTFRVSLLPGNITFGSMLMTVPFENMVEVFDLRGDHLLEALEFSLSHQRHVGAHMLQVAGMQIEFDNDAPNGSKVKNLKIRCIDCVVPTYEDWKNSTYYKVVTHEYLGQGGDGFSVIGKNRKNVEKVTMDYEAIQNYLKKHSPVTQGVEWRIKVMNPCTVSEQS